MEAEDASPYIQEFPPHAEQELESSEICELYLEKNPSTIRPLLALNRFDISKLCIYWELPVYPDQSNQKMSFLRNRVRKQLLPTIKLFFNSRIENVLLQFAEIFYDEDHYINQITNKLFSKLDSASTFAHSPPTLRSDGYYDQTLLPIDSPLYTSGLEVQYLLDAHQSSGTQNKNALATTCSCYVHLHQRCKCKGDVTSTSEGNDMVHLMIPSSMVTAGAHKDVTCAIEADYISDVTKKDLCTEDASWSSPCFAQRFTECIFFAPAMHAKTWVCIFDACQRYKEGASEVDPRMEPSFQPLKRCNARVTWCISDAKMRRNLGVSATLYTCNIAYVTHALHYNETSEKVYNQIHFTGGIFFAHAHITSEMSSASLAHALAQCTEGANAKVHMQVQSPSVQSPPVHVYACENQSEEKIGDSKSYVSLNSQKFVSANHYIGGTKTTLLQANAIFKCEVFAVSLHFFRFSLFSIKRRKYIVVPKMYKLCSLPFEWTADSNHNSKIADTFFAPLACIKDASEADPKIALNSLHDTSLHLHDAPLHNAHAPKVQMQRCIVPRACAKKIHSVKRCAKQGEELVSVPQMSFTCSRLIYDFPLSTTSDVAKCWSACSNASLVFLRGTEKMSQAVWSTPIVRGKRQKQITFNYFISYLYSKGVADRLIMHMVHHDQLTFHLLWTEIKLNGHYITPSSTPSGLLLFKRLYKNCQATTILYPIKTIPRYSVPMGATFWVWNRKLYKTKKFSRISTSYLSIKSNSLFSFYQRWLTESFAEQQCNHISTFFSRSELRAPNGDCICDFALKKRCTCSLLAHVDAPVGEPGVQLQVQAKRFASAMHNVQGRGKEKHEDATGAKIFSVPCTKGVYNIRDVIRFACNIFVCTCTFTQCTEGAKVYPASACACRKGLSRSAHMKDASDKSLVYLLNAYNKQKNVLLSTLNKPFSWHRNSASLSKRNIIITSLAFSMSARRAAELTASPPERADVESSLHLRSASRARKINRAGGDWECIFFAPLAFSPPVSLISDSTSALEADPCQRCKEGDNLRDVTCEMHLFLSAKMYCNPSVRVKVPTPISHSSPIALGYYVLKCKGQVEKPKMERLSLKTEELIINHKTSCLRSALMDCRFPCSNSLGESSEATIRLALPIPLELSARIAIGRFFAPSVMEGRWKNCTWELGKTHKTCILAPRIAHVQAHALAQCTEGAKVHMQVQVQEKKTKKNTNKLGNIFSKFDKLEIEKKEIYWPLIISFLPKAIQRRFVKLFLINQNLRQVRYSQIEQFLSIIKKS